MEQSYDSYDAGAAGAIAAMMGVILIPILIIAVVCIIASWKIYTKAGKPGWAAIIPIYSTIVLLEIVGKPVWWFFLMLIPFVNIIIIIMVLHQLSLSFGKDVGMTLLLLFLPFIGYPVLGFGSATYLGPGGTPTARPV